MKRACKAWLLAAVMVGSVASTVCADISFKWAPYVRARYEYWKNNFDLSNDAGDDRGFYRLKLSLWGQMDVDKKYSVFGKLTNESKIFTQYDNGNEQYNIGETIFDNLYVDIKSPMDLPVDFRIGRQDFLGMYGEGFLIGDGTPVDGSRTFYFNAAKAAWKINDQNTLDAIYIRSYKYDQFMGINKIESTKTRLNASAEDGYVLYNKMNVSSALKLENYFIRKDEWWDGATANRVNTIGNFTKYAFEGTPYALRGQLAYQFGEISDGTNKIDNAALGGYAFIDGSYKDAYLKPTFSAGYLYFSGDDPATDKNEGFNPLYSRYSWLSELFIYTISADGAGNGYWSNLGVARLSGSIIPCDKTKVTLTYNQLYANQDHSVTSVISNKGKDRGMLLQGKIDYKINTVWSTYLLSEYFKPGNYYVDGSDEAVFARAEVQMKF